MSDIIVVGAGIVGLSVSHAAARAATASLRAGTRPRAEPATARPSTSTA